MFLRSLPAFLVLPGIAAFVLPPVLAAVDHWRSAVWRQGTIVMVVGLVFLLWCVRDFYVAGKGTLAPWDPPKHLVLVGLSRYVRNPMYMGVLTLLAGWTIFFASPLLAIYTVALAAGFHIRVRLHEEPMLRSRFGDQWERYCASVARWAPRLKAWRRDFQRRPSVDAPSLPGRSVCFRRVWEVFASERKALFVEICRSRDKAISRWNEAQVHPCNKPRMVIEAQKFFFA